VLEPLPRGQYYLDPSQIRIWLNAVNALRQLDQAGLRLICVTNQPIVARDASALAGVLDVNLAVAESILGNCDMEFAYLPMGADFSYIQQLITQRGQVRMKFLVCPHGAAAGCPCRKPAPGLILSQANEVDIRHSYMLGDTPSDILAGLQAGVRASLYVGWPYGNWEAITERIINECT